MQLSSNTANVVTAALALSSHCLVQHRPMQRDVFRRRGIAKLENLYYQAPNSLEFRGGSKRV